LGIFDDGINIEHKEEAISWEIKEIWVWVGAPWGNDGYMWFQGVTHINYLIMIYRDLGCIWEMTGPLGSVPRNGNHIIE